MAVSCTRGSTGPDYDPQIPTEWAAAVDNPFFPLVPGTTLEYEAQTGGGLQRTVVEILNETRVVNGVTAITVRDRVYVDGELIEDTHDWYAQDAAGNVWYLGEETAEYEAGVVVSTAGSWEWGVDGALPGVVMWSDPAAHIGEEYRQEFYEGQAEDWAKILTVGEAVTVPFGNLTGCIRTEDWNALASGVEHKYYCPQIGFALELAAGERVELVSRTP